MMGRPVNDLSWIILEEFHFIAGPFKTTDMKDIVITQLICSLKYADLRRADQTVIGFPVIHAALDILDTVINAIQLCLRQKL